MSNGTRSCPKVTLPFGLFAGTDTIGPLDPADFPTADQPPKLEQFIIDNAPTDATPLDGFESVFTEAVGIVDALERALGGLESELVAAFGEADLIDPTPVADTIAGYTATLDLVSAGVDDLGKLVASASPPTPGGGGGVGGGQSAHCGKHGQSSVGTAVDPRTVDVLLTLPIASIADGPCTSSFEFLQFDPRNPNHQTVQGWKLAQGDQKLFTLATHGVANDDHTSVTLSYDITVTPAAAGKYFMVGVLTLGNPTRVTRILAYVDVIA